MNHTNVRQVLVAGALLIGALVTGCGSSSSDVSGTDFAGTWAGTKTYQGSDGSSGSADWTVTIRDVGQGRLALPGDVGASITSASTFEVEAHTYPPAFPPGPLGHCVPLNSTITSGNGALDGQGRLQITLRWSNECGGATSTMTTVYDLQRGAGTEGGL